MILPITGSLNELSKMPQLVVACWIPGSPTWPNMVSCKGLKIRVKWGLQLCLEASILKFWLGHYKFQFVKRSISDQPQPQFNGSTSTTFRCFIYRFSGCRRFKCRWSLFLLLGISVNITPIYKIIPTILPCRSRKHHKLIDTAPLTTLSNSQDRGDTTWR